MKRSSGVLMHISSLPNDYGIGTMGQSAYEFVDFLVETGQSYWQILPLTTTSYGDSPYQSFSAFAGNTNLIDLDQLIAQDLLEKNDLEGLDFGQHADKVDYQKIERVRRPLLEKAVKKFISLERHQTDKFKVFVESNNQWLQPFVAFMTVKEHFDSKPLYEWPDAYRLYDAKLIEKHCQSKQPLMDYYKVTQYFFFSQWHTLKDYANKHQIEIIGDIPIYVSRDSVEMWQQPDLFLVDENKQPTAVAGVPPGSLSDKGQHWGNPVYDWPALKETNYQWWMRRFKESFLLYDWVRIDHFRGFESYWEIPYEAEDARAGSFKKGPGIDLFDQARKEFGELQIIAEDLGFITDEVIELREKTGFPGMNILQYGFNGFEDNEYLPHHYVSNSVAYVGTHDNPTGREWYEQEASDEVQEQVDRYLNRRPNEPISDALNRGVAASTSKMLIYTMQDLLGLGEEGRMNIPSTVGGNWDWRMKPDAITDEVKDKLLQLTQTYFRMNDK